MGILVESWIWYSFALSMVILRFTARILHFKSIWRLQVEDWLMLFITCLYTIEIEMLNIDATVQTNLINPADIPHLTPTEIAQRTWGSKMILLVEQCMCAVQWGTKLCLLILYWRLTQDLRQSIIVKIAFVYVALTYVVMEICYFAVWCHPFYEYWKTPTGDTQCATALHHLIMNFSFNLSSDLLIMSIPLPLFLRFRLPWKRKLLLVFPFSLGLFTIVCAILSKHLSFTQPFSGDWVFWYCREASTAMIVSNMPYTWSLLRRAFNLKSFFGDSTVDEARAGSVLNGVSVPGNTVATLTSASRIRSSVFFPSRKGKNSDSSPSEEVERCKNSWHDVKPDLETNANTTLVSSASSEASVSKAPPVDTTSSAMDKLYRLDDDDEFDLVGPAEKDVP